MNNLRPDKVSVIDPISPAIDRVKVLLFRPFNLSKWLVIGFCAWLAYLGSGGGGGSGSPNFNFNPPSGQSEQHHLNQEFSNAKEFILDNLFWIVPVTVFVVLLIIVISLLITWLNSRGKFMFLHCIAENKAEIGVPWRKFKKQANSLFLFRIILGIIGFFTVGLPILGIIFLFIMMVSKTIQWAAFIPVIVIFGLFIFTLSIVLFLVQKFTMDFVVPIMFLRSSGCLAAWRQFMTTLSANKLRLALYLLFQIVISIAIGAIIGLGFCIGCCLCCISVLMLIPYIGTVIILPLLVFKRAYSLYYLRQFGPQFDVFSRPVVSAPSP